MTYKKISKKQNWRLVTLVILLSITVHIGIFWLIKDYTIQQTQYHKLSDSLLQMAKLNQRQVETKQRQLELQHTFSRLKAQSIYPENIKSSFETELPSMESISYNEKSADLDYDLKDLLKDFQELGVDQTTTYAQQTTISTDETQSVIKLKEKSKPTSETIVMNAKTLLSEVNPSSHFNLSESFDEIVGIQEPLAHPKHQADDLQSLKFSERFVSTSSDFLVDLDFAPQTNDDGYIFKIILRAKPHKKYKRIKQNYYFLVDRSHSIPKSFFHQAKDSICSALEQLTPSDHFNVIFFDSKVLRFDERTIAASTENIAKAQNFIQKTKKRGMLSGTDLYSSLDKILPSQIEEDEIHSAILISDGDSYLSNHKKRKVIDGWTKRNSGKISLYSLAIGSHQNLPLLDLLSYLNKGHLSIAQHPDDVQPQLNQLIRNLANPLAKELTTTVVPYNTKAKVEIFPQNTRLKNLYGDLEYVLYGKVDQLTDFSLFVQGKYYDQWLDILKPISLTKGQLVDEVKLKKDLLLQLAYGELDQYLDTAKAKHLTQAQTFLEPLQLSSPLD